MSDPLFEALVDLVEAEFFDEDFLAGPWTSAREDAAERYAAAGSTTEREELLRGLLAVFGVSHTLLITPEIRAEIDRKTGDPRRLRPLVRRSGRTVVAAVRSMKAETTTRDDIEALAREVRDADEVVLDLRLNDGGSGVRVAEVASLFLSAGTPVLRVRDRVGRGLAEPYVVTSLPEDENRDHSLEVSILRREHLVEYRTPQSERRPCSGAVVVLVGPRCYSCGEVLAQAMKEGGATLVGARTAGMVVAADEHDLPGGYGLLFPFAEMESGRGERIEGRGVSPHVEADLEDLEDGALLRRLLDLGLVAKRETP